MSFIWKADAPLRTPEQVAAVVRQVATERGLGDVYVHAALACIKVESDFWCPWNAQARGSNSYPYDSQSDDGRSVGYFQQQTGPNGELWWGPVSSEMDLTSSCAVFLSRCPDGLSYAMGTEALGTAVANVQNCAPADRGRYAEEWDGVQYLVAASPTPAPPPPVEEPPVANSKRPSYNEFPIWSPSNQSRAGQAPRLFLLHTQEPGTVPPADNAAESLGNYCADPNPQVSYHYYVSQAADGGVTVVDGVDTDSASWSVGDANDYSINLCFAGSSASWDRATWLKYAGNAIDVAAYLAIQDIAKYPTIPNALLGTGGHYTTSDPSRGGIADHEFVTDVIGWGTHKDVGPGFPVDVLADRLSYWAVGGESQAPPPVVPAPPVPTSADADEAFIAWYESASDTDLLRYIVAQLGPGDPAWASKGKTLRDKVFGV